MRAGIIDIIKVCLIVLFFRIGNRVPNKPLTKQNKIRTKYRSYKFFIKFLRPLPCSTQVISKIKFTLPRKCGNDIVFRIVPDRKICSVNFLLDNNVVSDLKPWQKRWLQSFNIHKLLHLHLIHHSLTDLLCSQYFLLLEKRSNQQDCMHYITELLCRYILQTKPKL